MKATGITRNLSCAYGALKELLALVGLAAVLGFMFVTLREPVERALPSLPSLPALIVDPLAITASPAERPIPANLADTARERERRAVAEFIARRYRVAEDAVMEFVAIAYRAGAQHAVDPLLILAVMAIESRYNPVAESVMGARGLMQVIPRYHPEKLEAFGGEEALLEPEVNIQVGAQILREYQRRFGDLETALQMYAGAFDDPASQYAGKVLAEKARLDALRAKSRKTPQSA